MTITHPIVIESKLSVLAKDIDFYLCPEMYIKNKFFMKTLIETSEVNITSTMLQNFRVLLNDQQYTV